METILYTLFIILLLVVAVGWVIVFSAVVALCAGIAAALGAFDWVNKGW